MSKKFLIWIFRNYSEYIAMIVIVWIKSKSLKLRKVSFKILFMILLKWYAKEKIVQLVKNWKGYFNTFYYYRLVKKRETNL